MRQGQKGIRTAENFLGRRGQHVDTVIYISAARRQRVLHAAASGLERKVVQVRQTMELLDKQLRRSTGTLEIKQK